MRTGRGCTPSAGFDRLMGRRPVRGLPNGEPRMSTITVSTECGTTKRFDNHRDAEAGKRAHTDLCEECSVEDVDVSVDPDQITLQAVVDGNGTLRQVSDESVSETQPAQTTDDVRSDPLDVVPDSLISEVDGRPVLETRGYAILATRLDIAVQSEPVTTAGETDHKYAEFRATAWKKDEGPECGYTGYATARSAEARPDIEHNLNEVAEARAMERAVAWASGVGLFARVEADGYLDGTGEYPDGA